MRGVAQLVAYLVWDQRVVSSSLATPTKENKGVRQCLAPFILKLKITSEPGANALTNGQTNQRLPFAFLNQTCVLPDKMNICNGQLHQLF